MFATIAGRNLFVALIALVVVAVAPSARAQQPQPQPSPASLLIAKQIVELKGVRELFDPMVRGVVDKAKAMFMQTNFNLAKDLNEVAANLHREYDARSAEVIDQTARIYANHFSELELKELLKFYQSPIGKKMITEEPKALDQSMAAGAKWADELSENIVGRFRAEMKKRGHDL
jgi:hypothetical protein